jgi:hypothetical protein
MVTLNSLLMWVSLHFCHNRFTLLVVLKSLFVLSIHFLSIGKIMVIQVVILNSQLFLRRASEESRLFYVFFLFPWRDVIILPVDSLFVEGFFEPY